MKSMNYYRVKEKWELRIEDAANGEFSTTKPVLKIDRPDGGTTYRTIFEPPIEGETETEWHARHAAHNPKGNTWTAVEIEYMPRMREKQAAEIEALLSVAFFQTILAEARGEDVTVRRAALRQIDPAAGSSATTPAELAAAWPTELAKLP